MEGERKSFNKGKRDSETKLQSKTAELGNNKATLKGMTEDYDKFISQAKKDKDGNVLNLITLDGVESKKLGSYRKTSASNVRKGKRPTDNANLLEKSMVFPLRLSARQVLKMACRLWITALQ